ncbi:MAG TPA: hypothetical protein VJI12_00785 [archaeon]|nr:hypothetical protein [archaeon]
MMLTVQNLTEYFNRIEMPVVNYSREDIARAIHIASHDRDALRGLYRSMIDAWPRMSPTTPRTDAERKARETFAALAHMADNTNWKFDYISPDGLGRAYADPAQHGPVMALAAELYREARIDPVVELTEAQSGHSRKE